MAAGTFPLTTSPTILFDARTAAEGGLGDARNVADLITGRIKGCSVQNDSASASLITFHINGEAADHPVPVGSTGYAINGGKIYLVTATAVSTATAYFGWLSR